MQFVLTKKVQDYLGIRTLESYAEQDFFYRDWIVNYFTRRRRKIFVFMNRKTKFIVVVPFTNKKNLIYDFVDKLELELIKSGVPNDKRNEMYLDLENITFVKNQSKSVTGVLVQIIKDLENLIYSEMFWRENLAELSNTSIVKSQESKVGYEYPVVNLFKELDLSLKLIVYEELKVNTIIKSN